MLQTKRMIRDGSDRVATEELGKACLHLRGAGVDIAILTSHENIAYVSHFDEPVPIGSTKDAADGLPLAVAIVNVREEAGLLLVVEGYEQQASRQNVLGTTLQFSTFSVSSRVDASARFGQAARQALSEAGLRTGSGAVIGVEPGSFPVALQRLLAEGFGATHTADLRPALEQARLTKTEREVQLLRRSAAIADAGQLALVQAARSFLGATEFEVWGAVSGAVMEAADATCPMPLIGELVSGPRTGVVRYPGGPRRRRIVTGDTGILDISARVDGYWSDCCNTVVFGGEPTGEQQEYFLAARDGFEAAAAALRPGVRCCDIEAVMRDTLERHGFAAGRYGGHQIGATVNERPRIVPWDTTAMEAGMVFCLEPGVYAGPEGTTGARLERMVLVTESGSEILNRFPWGMEQGLRPGKVR